MEKGALVYDESHQNEMKKRRMRLFWIWGGWQFATLLCMIVIMLFLYFLFNGILFLIFFLPIVIIVAIPYLLGSLSQSGDLKVYENGIQYPRMFFKEVFYNRNFAPFQDIEKVEINEEGTYVIHILRNGQIDLRGLYQDDIFDEEKFVKSIKNKVKILKSN